jgi:hypothetical protein
MRKRTRIFDAGCGDGLACSAVFSPDETWRYELRRVWDPTRPSMAFVGLNPSTADARHDDPTVRRCINFAKRWGFGGLIMLNAFAFRAADPREMMAAADPVGPDNDSAQVTPLLGELWALGKTKGDEPLHPLYVRGDTERIAYTRALPG